MLKLILVLTLVLLTWRLFAHTTGLVPKRSPLRGASRASTQTPTLPATMGSTRSHGSMLAGWTVNSDGFLIPSSMSTWRTSSGPNRAGASGPVRRDY